MKHAILKVRGRLLRATVALEEHSTSYLHAAVLQHLRAELLKELSRWVLAWRCRLVDAVGIDRVLN